MDRINTRIAVEEMTVTVGARLSLGSRLRNMPADLRPCLLHSLRQQLLGTEAECPWISYPRQNTGNAPMIRCFQTYLLMIICLGAFVLAPSSSAMNLKLVGDQLILNGPVEPGDDSNIQGALAENPAIRTVILRNSPGGDVRTAYAISNLIRAKQLRTAVSGYCYSACSRLFLAGVDRLFTDDYPPCLTRVGFHGHYYADGLLKGQLNRHLVEKAGLKNWIIEHSDGKADPDLVERWINIPVYDGFIHFFPPWIINEQKSTTFFCEHGPSPGAGIFGCEPIGKNALDLGIITSLKTIASLDQGELHASFPKIPPKTDYARIDDLEKLPVRSPKALAAYMRYLTAVPPKAFAISSDKCAFAWRKGGIEAVNGALARCAELAGTPCRLYAVDGDVVW
jgi:hypothetical protein